MVRIIRQCLLSRVSDVQYHLVSLRRQRRYVVLTLPASVLLINIGIIPSIYASHWIFDESGPKCNSDPKVVGAYTTSEKMKLSTEDKEGRNQRLEGPIEPKFVLHIPICVFQCYISGITPTRHHDLDF
jgi:hypothetical protein